ncbi:MAG: 1-acyl-sn-glycerol-3-phosphate acyltransferase [Planctomycetes bacterium]|nr:1-acyl-sn-glycerol-3-phosphate acyltransferase [Planctomycetota bacterium]
MGDPITLPLWQFLLLVTLALWASLTLILVPSVRWFLRRRVNRVLERVDRHLHIRLQPFKMTKRRVLIDRLVYDPEVLAAMDEYLTAEDLPREVALARVERYAHEIVPAFNAYAYFAFGYWISRKVAASLFRLRLGTTDEAGLEGIDPKSTVVFVMNHRSNMDYVMVSYLAASRTALSYAVGEWARIWPLQQLIRAMGAYFVRRRSRNALYRKVLERYVQMATASGVTQAIFPEGGLSRDGKLGPAKLGLLDYMVRDFDPRAERDVVFVPVGLNYDRTFEDRSLLLSQRLTEAEDLPRTGRARAAWTAIRFLGRNLGLMLRNKWFRFGYACVNFGSPVSLRAWLGAQHVETPRALSKEARFEVTQDLAEALMGAIGQVVPVLPVALVAEVFLDAGKKALSKLEVEARVHRRIEALEASGAKVYVPRRDRAYAIDCGLRMLTLRRLVVEAEGLFVARDSEVALLRYYANSIAHLAPESVRS